MPKLDFYDIIPEGMDPYSKVTIEAVMNDNSFWLMEKIRSNEIDVTDDVKDNLDWSEFDGYNEDDYDY